MASFAYQAITRQIIEAIEMGARGADWQMPWHRGGKGAEGLTGGIARPRNLRGTGYRGVNVLALWARAQASGYATPLWATYKQWAETGAQVRKGEKSTLVVFSKQVPRASAAPDEIQEGEEINTKSRMVWIMRAYNVFNVAQVEGYSVDAQPEPTAPIDPTMAWADAYVRQCGARLNVEGDRAFYSLLADAITMPAHARFFDTKHATKGQHYASTALHELTHWTGRHDRCARKFGNAFGTKDYAFEELVAELGAAFLGADLGIASQPRADHAEYIAGWLEKLERDNRAIFKAASLAERAVSFIQEAYNAGATAIAAE